MTEDELDVLRKTHAALQARLRADYHAHMRNLRMARIQLWILVGVCSFALATVVTLVVLYTLFSA